MKKILILAGAFVLTGCLATVQSVMESTANMAEKLAEFSGVDNTTFKRVGSKRIKEINVYPAKYSEKAGRYVILQMGVDPKRTSGSRKIYKLPVNKVSFNYDETGYLSLQTVETPNINLDALNSASQDAGVYLQVDETTKYAYDKNAGRVKVFTTRDGNTSEYSYVFADGYPVKYYSHINGVDKRLKDFEYSYGTLKMERAGNKYTKYKYGKWGSVTVEQGDFSDSSLPVTSHEIGKMNFKFSLAGVAVAAHQIYSHKVDGVVVDTMQIDSRVVDDKHKAPETTPLTTPINKYENLVYDADGYILSLLNKNSGSTQYPAEIIEFVYEDGAGNAKFFNTPKGIDEQLGFIKYF